VLSVVDYAPENALRAHLPVLRVPRIRAFRRLAGESANIFTASTERHGAWRWSVEAEFPASFAKLQLLGAASFALGILFSPEDTEMSVRHLVGSFTWVQQERVVLVATRSVHSLQTMAAFDPACYFRNAAVEVILSDWCANCCPVLCASRCVLSSSRVLPMQIDIKSGATIAGDGVVDS
jgi:hypothetical protein